MADTLAPDDAAPPHDEPAPPPRRPHRFTPETAKAARARRERLRATQDNPPGNARATQPNDLGLIARAARRALRRKGVNARVAAELGRLLLDIRKLETGQQGRGHKGTPRPPPTNWRERLMAQAAAEDASAAVADTEAEQRKPTGRTLAEVTEPGTDAGAADAHPAAEAMASAPEPASDPALTWNQWDRETWVDVYGRLWHRVCLASARVPPGSHRFNPRRDTPREGQVEICVGCGRPLVLPERTG